MSSFGVDPGVSGAIAVLDDDGQLVEVISLDPDEVPDNALIMRLQNAAISWGYPKAAVEQVGSRPGNSAKAMFTFGDSFGRVKMALAAAQIPYQRYTPSQWMGDIGMRRKKNEPRTKWKNRLKARASELFPSHEVTLRDADALLLARYCHERVVLVDS